MHCLRLFALAALLLGLHAAANAAEDVDLELVLAAHASDEIAYEEFIAQRAGYAAAISHPGVLAAIRSGPARVIALAYVEFGGFDSQRMVVDWTLIRDEASARSFAERLMRAPRATERFNSVTGVLEYATTLMQTNDFAGARKVIDVASGEAQAGGPAIEPARQRALAQGITINALAIKSLWVNWWAPGFIALDQLFEKHVIGGEGAFVLVAETRRQLPEIILQKLVREISGDQRMPASRSSQLMGSRP